MTPLIEQLRHLLRQVRQRAQARHDAYVTCEEGYASRRDVLEQTWNDTRYRLEQFLAQRTAALEEEATLAREKIVLRHGDNHHALQSEFAALETKAEQTLEANQKNAETEFKENRWTILTLWEADKKVARDEIDAAHTELKKNGSQMREEHQEGRALVKSWKCARRLQLSLNPRPNEAPDDPWEALAERAQQTHDSLVQLRALALPRIVQGRLVPLAVFLMWILLSLPALLIEPWYVWLLATTATVLPAGWAMHYWMLRRARQQITTHWGQLAQAVYDAQPLRRLCMQQARQLYRQKRERSRKKHRAALEETTSQYRQHIKRLQTRHDQQARQAEEKLNAALEQIEERRDRELHAVEEKLATGLAQAQAADEREKNAAHETYRQAREENERRHDGEWQQLASDWQHACEEFAAARQALEDECQRTFPAWDDVAENWHVPADLPRGIPFGTLDLSSGDILHSEPEDDRLARLDLMDGITLPALLPFPERSSLMFKAVDQGRELAVHALQAVLLRFWTSLPPGKLRCTIIDPVGRGENFAAFMHLADQDESLITSRIWTETSHIEQRLADLTTHMETVLQKFLRNKYQTLAEYNAQAGEVAEPFRLLIVAHFPVNFSTEAARRLISLAGAGARCGIYVLVLVDEKQPLPHSVELSDLEAACMNLVWREGRFVWRDIDFGDYLLRLSQPPPAETCTEILDVVGEKAKLANRVEVPFESIAPSVEEMWTADSRAGIAVPLGRTGATARQLLTLGRGTSQHVLIAGKTGSGKSTLLHVLITQLVTRYSPEEVELYLIDFKKGVEFKTYASHQVPHARVVAVESEREFGLSVLQRLDAELVRRGELFRNLGVNDLPSYRDQARTASGDRDSRAVPFLPRVLFIVDEFQEFFVEDDKIAQEAALLLDRLVRQGRAFGIHVILGSQTLGGAYSLARSTIDQMAVRIALQCSEADAHLILSKENSEARLLSRPGEAIYNSANGMLEGNNLFQVVWLSDERRDRYLEHAHDLAKNGARQPAGPMIVFEGSTPSDLSANPWLQRNGQPATSRSTQLALHAWLGDAVAIKDPTAAIFRRQSGANLLIIGQNADAAFHLMMSSLVSLAAQRSDSSLNEAIEGTALAPFSLVVGSPLQGESEALFQHLPELLPVRLIAQREVPALLNSLSEEMQRRQKDSTEGPPLFLLLYGLQRLRDLRKPDDDYAFSRRGEEKQANPAKQFQTLVRDGPPLGIFTLLWSDTLTNLQRSIDRQGLREFEMRVLFQMNAADSSNLLDTPVASKLGPHRALFYTEDQGKIEKFRPYGPPSLEWLRRLFQDHMPIDVK